MILSSYASHVRCCWCMPKTSVPTYLRYLAVAAASCCPCDGRKSTKVRMRMWSPSVCPFQTVSQLARRPLLFPCSFFLVSVFALRASTPQQHGIGTCGVFASAIHNRTTTLLVSNTTRCRISLPSSVTSIGSQLLAREQRSLGI